MEHVRPNSATPSPAKIPTYFRQECTVCGRQLQVAVELLGKQVGCRHCGHRFTARDLTAGDPGLRGSDSRRAESLLERADRLLAQLESGGPAREACRPRRH